MRYTTFRPLLAAALVRPSDSDSQLERNLQLLRYPVYATPKIDGIRLFTDDKVPIKSGALSLPTCRSLKPLPNLHTSNIIADLSSGFDGEAVTYERQDLFSDGKLHMRPFHQVQSDLMSVQGDPTFRYHVFGCHVMRRELRYLDMIDCLERWEAPDFVIKVLPTRCDNPDELTEFFAKCIADGHEGVCLRTGNSPMWKCTSADGRSSLKEQWLVKWKLFHEQEAEIIGVEEEMRNNNPQSLDARGLQVRSSHQDNMVGKGRLGALICRIHGVEFKIGTGFSAQQRENLWLAQAALPGQFATFKSQSFGAHEAPRIPVFKAIRDPRDIS